MYPYLLLLLLLLILLFILIWNLLFPIFYFSLKKSQLEKSQLELLCIGWEFQMVLQHFFSVSYRPPLCSCRSLISGKTRSIGCFHGCVSTKFRTVPNNDTSYRYGNEWNIRRIRQYNCALCYILGKYNNFHVTIIIF